MTDECKTVVSRDGCVVESESLAGVLGPFISSWTRDRPQTGGRYSAGVEDTRDAAISMTATAWLSQEATRRCEVPVTERTIEGIVNGRSKATELRVADALVAAIGRPDLFYDGTLTVGPNPFAKPDAQRECCGGSEPG